MTAANSRVLLLIGISLLAASCGTNPASSGPETRRAYELKGFAAVNATSAFETTIHRGSEFRVEIVAGEREFDKLDIRVEGNTLHLARKSMTLTGQRARAEITMPELKGLKSSGASMIRAEGFSSESPLDIESSGASKIEADLDAGSTTVKASGASNVKLTGRGTRLTVDLSGASNADLGSYKAEDTRVEVSGASSATVWTKGRLDAEASGASRVTYLGSPTLGNLHDSGGSKIQQGEN